MDVFLCYHYADETKQFVSASVNVVKRSCVSAADSASVDNEHDV